MHGCSGDNRRVRNYIGQQQDISVKTFLQQEMITGSTLSSMSSMSLVYNDQGVYRSTSAFFFSLNIFTGFFALYVMEPEMS